MEARTQGENRPGAGRNLEEASFQGGVLLEASCRDVEGHQETFQEGASLEGASLALGILRALHSWVGAGSQDQGQNQELLGGRPVVDYWEAASSLQHPAAGASEASSLAKDPLARRLALRGQLVPALERSLVSHALLHDRRPGLLQQLVALL